MIIDFSKDYQLRGYVMEYFARIMLRRQKKNNFIFMTSRFDNFSEILKKYRLDMPNIWQEKISEIDEGWRKFDIIECTLNNFKERRIVDLKFYDVKSKWHEVERTYYEACLSNHKFMTQISNYFETFIISIILFDNWKVSTNIVSYESVPIRVYDSVKKKRISFFRPNKHTMRN